MLETILQNKDLVALLINGGLATVALFLCIILLYKLKIDADDRKMNAQEREKNAEERAGFVKIVTNHLVHNEKSNLIVAHSMDKNTTVLDRVVDLLKK